MLNRKSEFNVLVTGCAGFIGSNLVDRLLMDGYHVVGIDSFTNYYSQRVKWDNIRHALKNPNFRLIKADILSASVVLPSDVDYVFHLAAQAGVRPSWGANFETYSRNNIEVTQRVLETYKADGLKKIIYASSSSVYGDVATPFSESGPVRPVSPYGVTKLAGEHLCYLYSTAYSTPTVCLRYFTVYGPRQRPDMAINRFFRCALSGRTIFIYGDGSQVRDFTFVTDVVEGTLRAAFSPVSGAVNIGGGSRISVRDLVALIASIAKVKVNVEFVEPMRGDPDATQADTTRQVAVLGWKPETDIEIGLRRYYEWFSTRKRILERD